MQVAYCDLCGTPLKESNYFIFYISEPQQNKFNEINEYYDYLKRVEKDVKEICPTCKHIIDKIFELRLQNLSALANDLLGIYNLPSLKNPKERKNGKDKK
jgi:hypothetical protein